MNFHPRPLPQTFAEIPCRYEWIAWTRQETVLFFLMRGDNRDFSNLKAHKQILPIYARRHLFVPVQQKYKIAFKLEPVLKPMMIIAIDSCLPAVSNRNVQPNPEYWVFHCQLRLLKQQYSTHAFITACHWKQYCKQCGLIWQYWTRFMWRQKQILPSGLIIYKLLENLL